MDFRLSTAVLAGKFLALLIRLTGGGATAAPGLYALKIDPQLVAKLSKKISAGTIIVSGTNGKTTTSRLISDTLSVKYKIIHNRQGSNLLRGIASTLIKQTTIDGRINADLAIWEVDEAVVPEALKVTSPKLIVLLNLFRDQLDRYGEVDSIRNKWKNALQKLSKSSTLILNADDPGISILRNYYKGKTVFFGINDDKIDLPNISGVGDITHCLNCQSNLVFSSKLSAHQGKYACTKCNFKRPRPQISASKIKFNTNFSTKINLSINNNSQTLNYNLPGLYNVYNVLASTAVAKFFEVNTDTALKKIKDFLTAFGRFQKIEISGKNIYIFLIKNPTGANEVLRTVSIQPKFDLLALLNDNFADGRDVSWIWDTNWEIIRKKTNTASISGTRAWDLAARLKYAGLNINESNISENINYSLQNTVKTMGNIDTLIILPTYTALLTLQKHLKSVNPNISKWQNQ